ncbi:MAG: YigZ family protein [Aeromicrobium sp.]|nr:MAG: YigZ family protein [Aeromicrobium sp.]
MRVESEEQARQFFADTRAMHHDARHHCTAFVLGPDGTVRRSNDDGEPSGTAGRPILDAISGRDLVDVAVVVTRWFGGTLLGTGGLTRAYGDSAAEALDAAGVRQRELWHAVEVRASHAQAGALEHRLHYLGTVTGVDYGADVQFAVAVRDLSDLDRIEFEVTGQIWQDA